MVMKLQEGGKVSVGLERGTNQMAQDEMGGTREAKKTPNIETENGNDTFNTRMPWL